MNDTTPLPRSTLFTGHHEFQGALRAGFAAAAAGGARALWLADADFDDWPLGERDVMASLAAWAAPHRRLTLVASHFEAVERRHPRWVAWRRDWSHLVHCCTNEEIEAARFPTLLLAADVVAVRRFDRGTCRGLASCEPRDLHQARQQVEALMQTSVAAFPVTPTGL